MSWILRVASMVTSAAFVIKACADDIGASVAGLCLLEVLYLPFLLAQWEAWLTLKPKKCKLIMSCVVTPTLSIHVKYFLAEHCPTCVPSQIFSRAKYITLGSA